MYMFLASETVPELGIYASDGDEPLSEDNIVDVFIDDYLVCKPLNDVPTVNPLIYVWTKEGNADGPRKISFDNEEDGSNR